MQLSIIIPTYNERENIIPMIPKLESLIKKLKLNAEIVIVDDSSPDGTADLAKHFNKSYQNIKVVVRKRKEGMGAAIKEGLDKAKGKILISMDIDSFDVKDIEKLYKKIAQGYDLVLGSRHIKGGIYEKKHLKTFIKYILSFFGNKLYKCLLVHSINDFSVNFRAIRKAVWIKMEIEEKGNTFMPEIIAEAYFKGYNIAQLPITFKERAYEKSKLNLFKESSRFLIKLGYFIYKYRIKKILFRADYSL